MASSAPNCRSAQSQVRALRGLFASDGRERKVRVATSQHRTIRVAASTHSPSSLAKEQHRVYGDERPQLTPYSAGCGLEEIGDGLWRGWFSFYERGLFDERKGRLLPPSALAATPARPGRGKPSLHGVGPCPSTSTARALPLPNE